VTHTPGPWRRGRHGGSVIADHPVPEIGGSDSVAYYGGHLIAESIAPQNLPIIETAPELLAALEGLVDGIDRQRNSFGLRMAEKLRLKDSRLARARAAIAKAKAP
jgi:hypothetical protein